LEVCLAELLVNASSWRSRWAADLGGPRQDASGSTRYKRLSSIPEKEKKLEGILKKTFRMFLPRTGA
jgi:hypothetical protein